MKKLLVVPIMLCHYILMAILFPIAILLIIISKTTEWAHGFTEEVLDYYDDYLMKPSARIHEYAIRIMKSDEIIKWINEASEKLKHGKPID